MIGDFGHGQPEGVMEDEDGALLRWKSPEAAVQLVAVVDRQELVGWSVGASVSSRTTSVAKCRPRRASA